MLVYLDFENPHLGLQHSQHKNVKIFREYNASFILHVLIMDNLVPRSFFCPIVKETEVLGTSVVEPLNKSSTTLRCGIFKALNKTEINKSNMTINFVDEQ